MAHISNQAEAAREGARHQDGRFGPQIHGDNDISLAARYTTATDIKQMITEALGAEAVDFDIDAISRDLIDEGVLVEAHNEYGYAIGWVDPGTDESTDAFWAITERHQYTEIHTDGPTTLLRSEPDARPEWELLLNGSELSLFIEPRSAFREFEGDGHFAHGWASSLQCGCGEYITWDDYPIEVDPSTGPVSAVVAAVPGLVESAWAQWIEDNGGRPSTCLCGLCEDTCGNRCVEGVCECMCDGLVCSADPDSDVTMPAVHLEEDDVLVPDVTLDS